MLNSDFGNTVIMDLGTSTVKLGYSGQIEPQMILPSYVSSDLQPNADGTIYPPGIEDLTSYIGLDVKSATKYKSAFMGHGMIQNFDLFSVFLNLVPSLMGYDSRTTPVLITDPIFNPPESRQRIGEIFFETLDCPALSIQPQPVCSILSGLNTNKSKSVSGLVVDCGDGSMQINPVYEGYPILSQTSQIPMAGKDVTFYLTNILRNREKIPANVAFELAQKYKENECYVCSDPIKELSKYDQTPAKYFTQVEYKASDGKKYSFQTGHERFMVGEFFFNPDIINADYKKALSTIIIETVYKCPVDTRRALFGNINLSGGSTMFKNFDRRLEKEIKEQLEERFGQMERITGFKSNIPEINIPKNKMQKYRVFAGGCVLADKSIFPKIAITKDIYNEYGSSVFRQSAKINP